MQQPTSEAPTGSNLLEVIALDAADARAAVRGGADRLELVQDMSADGLTPSIECFETIREAVDVPLRVMLRSHGGFAVSARELDELCLTAARLQAAGMEESVLGFLTADNDVDLPAVEAVLAAGRPRRWTFHRAIDFAADPALVWKSVSGLPGVDAVLTAGSSSGLDVAGLVARLGWEDGTPPWVVGGGLREEHIAPLREIGLTRFHVGSRVRHGASWSQPVDEAAVARWRRLIDR
ncbi:MAG TPA: copper homeostasis protein CutC [Acidothermaceae bacterium]|jgi:copper homeostasis protein|nr:copper homeostasis protein CutC [Acidothermaceae bacterium]